MDTSIAWCSVEKYPHLNARRDPGLNWMSAFTIKTYSDESSKSINRSRSRYRYGEGVKGYECLEVWAYVERG